MIKPMHADSIRKMMLMASVVVGAALFTGCTDDNYDLDDIDMTLGLGNGELALPTSSTAVITLSEVLELKENGDITEDADGYYWFQRKGDAVNPTITRVNTVMVKQASSKSIDFKLDLSGFTSAAARAPRRALTVNFSDEQKVGHFEYDGSLPREVVDINNADVQTQLNIALTFNSHLQKLMGQIDEITLTLPSFMSYEVEEANVAYEKVDNKVMVKNMSTAIKPVIKLAVKRLSFGKEDDGLGSLKITDGWVEMTGDVKMGIKLNQEVNISADADPSKCSVECAIDFMGDMLLTKVNGRFSPEISLSNLGHVKVTGLPDFLSEDGVKIDIQNPEIHLTLTSDLTVPGLIDGTINYERDGKTGSVKMPEKIRVKAATGSEPSVTKVCVCRDKTLVENPSQFDQIIETDELKNVLYPTVADDISFSADATADASQYCDFELGRDYTIQPSYEVMAPLAFGEDANILYVDDLDGWNDDIDDINLANEGYIVLTANVENRVPVYLNVDATPVDVAGNDISSEVDVEVTGEVAASLDGTTPTSSQVEVKITPKNGALKKLDGLKLSVSGSAKSAAQGQTVTGVRLNAKTHTLVAKDIKVKIVGGLVYDAN